MICAVLGIAPPLEESKLDELKNSIRVVEWTRTTGSWIVPDVDADNAPTLLVSCSLHTSSLLEEICSLVKAKLQQDNEYTCEVWASAPTILPLIRFSNDMETTGLSVVPQLLPPSVLPLIKEMVDEHIGCTEERIAQNHPQIVLGKDSFWFREIASRSKQRFDLLISKKTPLYDLVYKTSMTNPAIRKTVEDWLGIVVDAASSTTSTSTSTSEWEMDLSVVYSKPGAEHQGWHADGGHHSIGGGGRYAVCFFVPLVDLDDRVGFTQFWPGSHTSASLVGFGRFAEIAMATWDGKVSKGDAIAYDYRLLHRGMPNTHQIRPILQLLCRKSWYQETNNYGRQSLYDTTTTTTTNHHCTI